MSPLIGLSVKTERTIDGPCAACGETAVLIGAGAGPHSASLRCSRCGRHRGWLPKTFADFLLALVAQYGRPVKPITIRNSEVAATLGASAVEASTAP